MTAATSSRYEAHDGRSGVWPPAKAVYAVRACMSLAARPHARMKAKEIAEITAIPRGFLSKILGELRTAGLVSAHSGYYGGYQLQRPATEIHLDELLDAVGTREPFAAHAFADASVPFIVDLRTRLRAVASETLRNASLAELLSQNPT